MPKFNILNLNKLIKIPFFFVNKSKKIDEKSKKIDEKK
jgi:hypothetical protein